MVGVMPRDFGFPMDQQVCDRPASPARSPPGASPRGANAPRTDLVAGPVGLDASLAALSGGGADGLDQARAIVDEFVLSYHGRSTRTLLWSLNLVVGFLVLIAAANVSALFLARGTLRSAETALRVAIGAGRIAVMRPLVVEALLLAMGGGVLGVAIARVATGWFGAILQNRGGVPYWADFGLRPPLLLFAATLAAGATLLAGVIPALRTSRVDPSGALKAMSGGGTGRVGLLPILVGVEVTLACTLLLLSAFVVRGALGTVQRVGSFPLDDVLTAGLVLEKFDYPDEESRRLFYVSLERALGDDPVVDRFALASAMPGDGTSPAAIAVEGVAYDGDQDWPRVQRRIVDPRFFVMFGMETRAGRTFASTDAAGAAPVAVVNEAYARRYFSDRPAVGSRIRIREGDGEPVVHEVVGLVSDPGVSVDDGRRVPAVLPSAGAAASPRCASRGAHARGRGPGTRRPGGRGACG